jgi:hypothetical protein
MTGSEGDARVKIIQGLMPDGHRSHAATGAVIREFAHWERVRARPRPKRHSLGYWLDFQPQLFEEPVTFTFGLVPLPSAACPSISPLPLPQAPFNQQPPEPLD